MALPPYAGLVMRAGERMDLFGIGTEGGVHSAWRDITTGWANWFRTGVGEFSQDTAITVVSRFPDHLRSVRRRGWTAECTAPGGTPPPDGRTDSASAPASSARELLDDNVPTHVWLLVLDYFSAGLRRLTSPTTSCRTCAQGWQPTCRLHLRSAYRQLYRSAQ